MTINKQPQHKLVKVCGMRDADNIRAAEALGIDWIGFIFWSQSSRYVAAPPTYLPTRCKRVGVFVDEALETVKRTATAYSLDLIQLHGHETPEYADQLRPWQVVKAFNIATAEDLAPSYDYEGHADYFLFDTKAQQVGGNGSKFDWSVLTAYHGQTPFILSGGIGPDDAERVKAFHHPQCIGIDLNSRFELAPALKDIQKLNQFLQQL